MNNSSCSTDEIGKFVKPVLIIVSVFSFFGIPANLLSIVLILRAKQKKSTTTCLLLNLAIADAVNLLGVLLVATTLFVVNKSCNIHDLLAITLVPQNVANFTLAFIALERYNALVKAMNPFLVLLSKKNVKRILLVFWFVGLVIRVPIPIAQMTGHIPRQIAKYYYRCSYISTYFLPLLMVTFCYVTILKGVFYNRTILGKNVTNEAELLENKRFVRIMGIVTVAFWLSNFPIFIVKILYCTPYEEQISREITKVTTVILGCVSSTVNPYVYGLQSEKYRRQVKQLFGHRQTNTARIDSDQYQDTHL